MALLLFVLLWSSYAYFYQGMGDNEAARIDQLRALVEDRTVRIDKYFWNTADIVFFPPQNGSVYPNKAPGQTFLLAPIYAVLRVALLPLHALGVPEWVCWHLLTYLLTVGTASFFSALACVVLYRIARTMTGDRWASALAVIAIGLGTLLFPFATMFFSHAITASLLIFAFYLLFQLRELEGLSMRARRWRCFAAGLLLSMCVAGEYPAALAAGLLSLYALWIGWRWQISPREKFLAALIFGIGVSLGAIALLSYNFAAFGDPLYLAYQSYSRPGAYFHSTYARGWMGIRWNGLGQFLHALGAITIFPPLGLLYLKFSRWAVYANSPVLWIALPGLFFMLRKRETRAEGLLVLAMILAYLLFLTHYGESTYDWSGGVYLGPRHLIPLLPFLALPLAFGVRKFALLFYPLLGLSIFYMLLATAVEPRMPMPFEVPARDQLLPDFLHGRLAQNDHRLFDSGQHLLTRDSTAFNFAKLAGVPGRWQLAPLFFWWALLGSALLFAARGQGAGGRRFAKSGSAIVFLCACALALAPPVHHALTAPKTSGHGLLGKYFRNANWSGTPVEVQVDPTIDFDWASQMPLPPAFSVEWSGQLLIEQAGDYQFWLKADDGARLEIDGRVVIDATHVVLQEVNGGQHLEAGLHPIRVRYFNNLFGGSVHLWWELLGRQRQIIPSDVFVPDSAAINGEKARAAD